MPRAKSPPRKTSEPDPVRMRVYQNLLDAIAEEMGVALERTAYSPNIKERRDSSCALFDARGALIAQAAHIPVHLGSMHHAVEACIAAHDFRRGDVMLINDPYAGGTHLPDLTVVSAAFAARDARPVFYVASRAHHADVGGAVRGSMALFRDIHQEGVRIPPVLIRDRGKPVRGVETLLFANMRQPDERAGDLRAQLAALRVGEQGLARLLERCARGELSRYIEHLKDAAERHVRALLSTLPPGRYEATEFLESDGAGGVDIPLRVRIDIRRGGTALFDFAGSAPQVDGCMNASRGIVMAAVFYVLRSLAGEEIPSNAGCLRPVEVRIPPGSVLDPAPPAAVAGGNVETSQRLVDLLLAALAPALGERCPAQSQGTMNNVTLGGRRGPRGAFSYYETIGGGCGASARGPGASGCHSHMTNTRNTPIEKLEHDLPVIVREYSLRRGSGGLGREHGGDGIVREFELREACDAAILSERRARAPRGAAGGQAGRPGANLRIARDGRTEPLPAKWQGTLAAGERLRLETPGGGGYGAPAGAAPA